MVPELLAASGQVTGYILVHPTHTTQAYQNSPMVGVISDPAATESLRALQPNLPLAQTLACPCKNGLLHYAHGWAGCGWV